MKSGKSAVMLVWNARDQKWEEETVFYENCEKLFRHLARTNRLEKRIIVPKNTRLIHLWEEWVKRPMTAADRKRLEKAKKMPFSCFTEGYIRTYETDAALEKLDEIMRHTYLREEARLGNE